jgi:hypothetical protein
MENNLIERINRIAKHLETTQHPGAESVCKKLRAIGAHIEAGGIPGPEEFRYIDYYEPKKILPKCRFISPLWECKLGVMEYCKHRSEWEKGQNTCRKYAERTSK